MKRLITAFAAFAMTATLAAAAHADKLQDIISKGVVRIGVPLDVPPFGSQDANRNAVGLDVDLAQGILPTSGSAAQPSQSCSRVLGRRVGISRARCKWVSTPLGQGSCFLPHARSSSPGNTQGRNGCRRCGKRRYNFVTRSTPRALSPPDPDQPSRGFSPQNAATSSGFTRTTFCRSSNRGKSPDACAPRVSRHPRRAGVRRFAAI